MHTRISNLLVLALGVALSTGCSDKNGCDDDDCQEQPAELLDLERDALEIICRIDREVRAMPDADASAADRSAMVQQALADAGIPEDVGVLGQIAEASAENKAPLFSEAVVRHGLEETCADFPLVDEQ